MAKPENTIGALCPHRDGLCAAFSAFDFRWTERPGAEANRGIENSFQIDSAIGITDEIERANIQRGQVVPIFLRALRRTHNDHWYFSALILEMACDIPVCAVHQPKATKTGYDVFLSPTEYLARSSAKARPWSAESADRSCPPRCSAAREPVQHSCGIAPLV